MGNRVCHSDVSEHNPQKGKLEPVTELTSFLQEIEDAACGLVGDCCLALHLVFPHCVPRRDLVFGLDQNLAWHVQQLKDLLGLALAELFAKLQIYKV